MTPSDNLSFKGNRLEGWKCSCGEVYFESASIERILLANKLRKEIIKAKLGRIRSNLILRLPKEIESALGLKQGESVIIKLEGESIRIIPTGAAL